jgi:hypothetical protein
MTFWTLPNKVHKKAKANNARRGSGEKLMEILTIFKHF